MTFRILSVFLNYERIHQNTLSIHVEYVFLVIENKVCVCEHMLVSGHVHTWRTSGLACCHVL